MRRLIINADDLGLTSGVNRAIVEAHRHGIVTSATMMASAPAFEDAARKARSVASSGTPLSVGCHVVLADGVPLSPFERIPSLLQARDGVAKFRENLSQFAIAALTGKLDPKHVEAEAMAQINRLQQAGVVLSHFDTHKHVHMFPSVLRPLLRAAAACGITAVRNPFGPGDGMPLTRVATDLKLAKRFVQMNILRSFSPNFRREVARQGLRMPNGAVGVQVTGILDLDLFISIASHIPDGTWEFVCHPGYNDGELDGVRTRLRASREQELRVLTSPEASEALQRRGVQLISYNEL